MGETEHGSHFLAACVSRNPREIPAQIPTVQARTWSFWGQEVTSLSSSREGVPSWVTRVAGVIQDHREGLMVHVQESGVSFQLNGSK